MSSDTVCGLIAAASAIAGLVGGSLITLKIRSWKKISRQNNSVDQRNTQAKGDVVGRDKITSNR
jgi:hypothetical protein